MSASARAISMVRMVIDTKTLSAFAASSKLVDDDLGYALHVALRRVFGDDGPQPLRMLGPMGNEEGAATTIVLAYTDVPRKLVEHPSGSPSTPTLPHWDGDWSEASLDGLLAEPIVARPMPARWQPGTRFDFEVLVRPVRRASAGTRERHADTGSRARSGERDAFLSAIDAAPENGELDREGTYVRWLHERLAGAASMEGKATLVRFRRTRVRRSTHSHGATRLVEGPEALMKGRLAVRDPDAFRHLVERGVGRHVAFGYGMLLLKPAGGV